MPNRISRRLTVLTAALALTTLALTACNKTPARWCEEDATDTTVPNSYCEANTPGYEWEPDTDKKKPKKTTSKPKPTPRPTR